MEQKTLKHKIHEIIFEADTPAGKWFDVILLILILASIAVTMMETVEGLGERFASFFLIAEWGFTLFFTVEYILRIYSTKKSWKYIFSFYGIIDLLSILPVYLSFVLTGTSVFVAVKAFRLLRVFRVLKMVQFLKEYNFMMGALRASMPKIMVFLGAVMVNVSIIGTLMYTIESGTNPQFSSIPKGMYWAIVTMTTVGYGDIAPQTSLGQFFSACLMIMGYAIIAVPTGIVSAEVIRIDKDKKVEGESIISTQVCQSCSREGHDVDAEFCRFCGEKL